MLLPNRYTLTVSRPGLKPRRSHTAKGLKVPLKASIRVPVQGTIRVPVKGSIRVPLQGPVRVLKGFRLRGTPKPSRPKPQLLRVGFIGFKVFNP